MAEKWFDDLPDDAFSSETDKAYERAAAKIRKGLAQGLDLARLSRPAVGTSLAAQSSTRLQACHRDNPVCRWAHHLRHAFSEPLSGSFHRYAWPLRESHAKPCTNSGAAPHAPQTAAPSLPIGLGPLHERPAVGWPGHCSQSPVGWGGDLAWLSPL